MPILYLIDTIECHVKHRKPPIAFSSSQRRLTSNEGLSQKKKTPERENPTAISCSTARCSLLSIMKTACVVVLVLLVVSASSRDFHDRFQQGMRENPGMLERPQLEMVEDQEMQEDKIRRNDCWYCVLACSGYYECSRCCKN
ncbi:hypothetical protein ACROYT_G001005 [Oculina patagonica]